MGPSLNNPNRRCWLLHMICVYVSYLVSYLKDGCQAWRDGCEHGCWCMRQDATFMTFGQQKLDLDKQIKTTKRASREGITTILGASCQVARGSRQRVRDRQMNLGSDLEVTDLYACTEDRRNIMTMTCSYLLLGRRNVNLVRLSRRTKN